MSLGGASPQVVWTQETEAIVRRGYAEKLSGEEIAAQIRARTRGFCTSAAVRKRARKLGLAGKT